MMNFQVHYGRAVGGWSPVLPSVTNLPHIIAEALHFITRSKNLIHIVCLFLLLV
jgi:hypothetical protein